MTETITLYPGNWLYNASVIGFLISLEEVEKLEAEKLEEKKLYYTFKNDGSVEIKKDVFTKLDIGKRYFSESKISSIIGNSQLYRNYLQSEWKKIFPHFVESLSNIKETPEAPTCGLCHRKFLLPNEKIEELKKNLASNEVKVDFLDKFLEGIKRFDVRHNTILGPSLGEFPNGFWNKNQSFYVDPLCAYLIIHHHIAFTQLADGSEIFINAPSFNIMWHLNKYIRSLHRSKVQNTAKELLGMSIIEMALKLNIQFGKWTMMNIEIVSKYKEKKGDKKDENKIDFFSLPYEIISLLSNREIANLLYDIGEITALNLVLNGDFKRIVELAEKIFKIALKSNISKQEQEFINSKISLEKNKGNLISFSQKLFKLFALIEEKTKK